MKTKEKMSAAEFLVEKVNAESKTWVGSLVLSHLG